MTQNRSREARKRQLYCPLGNPDEIARLASPLRRSAIGIASCRRTFVLAVCGLALFWIIPIVLSIATNITVILDDSLVSLSIMMVPLGLAAFGLTEGIVSNLIAPAWDKRIESLLREIAFADDHVAIGTLLELLAPIGFFFSGYKDATVPLSQALTFRLLHAGADSLRELSMSQRAILWRFGLNRCLPQVAALVALHEIVATENSAAETPLGANFRLRRLGKGRGGPEVRDPAAALLDARLGRG